MERILFDKVREYLESKPFIKKTGCRDIYHFFPMHHTGSYSALGELERAICQTRVNAVGNRSKFKDALNSVISSINSDENTYQLNIDFSREDDRYVEFVSLILSGDVCDSLSSGGIKNSPEFSDRLYLEYRFRQQTSDKFAKKFELRFAEVNNNILRVYKKIKDIKDIDKLFKFGFAYSMEITSDAYLIKLEKSVKIFEELINI